MKPFGRQVEGLLVCKRALFFLQKRSEQRPRSALERLATNRLRPRCAGFVAWMNATMAGELLQKVRRFAAPMGPSGGVAGVRLAQRGRLRIGRDAEWMAFDAEETIDAASSGFVWRASVRWAPGVRVSVTDAFEREHGRLSVRLFGVLPLKSFAGPEVDKGQTMRYLAELAWCPPALWNSKLAWEELDGTTLRVHASGAAVDLRIGEDGRILGAEAQARPRIDENGRIVPTPWVGEFFDYGPRAGFMVPNRGVVSWRLGSELFAYWEAEIVDFGIRPRRTVPDSAAGF